MEKCDSENLLIYIVSMITGGVNIAIVLLSGKHPELVAALIAFQSALHGLSSRPRRLRTRKGKSDGK